MKYLLLLFPCFIFSQSMYNIEYIQKNNTGSYYSGTLLANKSESVYTIRDTTGIVTPKETADDGFIVTDVVDGMEEEVTLSLPLSFEPIVHFKKAQQYFTFSSPKIYEKGKIIIQDSLPAIEWKFTKETKEILEFTCHKAIGTYKCREYVVWFTKEIPLSIGPWHINGLPGAILEAKATDKYVEFTAIKIKQVKDNSEDIRSVTNDINKIKDTISYSEYLDKLEEASVALSKSMINNISENMSEKKLEGASITSITTVSSFETHDLCREIAKKSVTKKFD